MKLSVSEIPVNSNGEAVNSNGEPTGAPTGAPTGEPTDEDDDGGEAGGVSKTGSVIIDRKSIHLRQFRFSKSLEKEIVNLSETW